MASTACKDVGPTPPLGNTVMARLYLVIKKHGVTSIRDFYDKCGEAEWMYFATKLQEKMISKVNSMISIVNYGVVKFQKDRPMAVLGKYVFERKNMMDLQDASLVLDEHFRKNSIDPASFVEDLFKVLRQDEYKMNTFRITGAPDTGKSLILRAVVEPFIANIQGVSGCASEFYFADMVNKSVILLEELWVTDATADDFKSLLSGYPFQVAVKHSNHRETILRTPVLVTSNHAEFGKGYLNPTDEEALGRRCYTYRFDVKFEPYLPGYEGDPAYHVDVKPWQIIAWMNNIHYH